MSMISGNDNKHWTKLVASADLQDDVKMYIMSCRIEKVRVSRKEGKWDIFLNAQSEPTEGVFASLHNIWQRFAPGSKVDFHFSNVQHSLELKELWEKQQEGVFEKLIVNNPSLRGWLVEADYLIEKERLQIVVGNETAYSYLNAQNIESKLEKLLAVEYNCKAQVAVILSKDNSDVFSDDYRPSLKKIEEDYRQKILKNVEMAANKSVSHVVKGKNSVVMGRKITAASIPILSIVEEEKDVVIKGFIFNYEKRLLKSGRILLSFAITDKHDSLACKIIDTEEKLSSIASLFQSEENYCYLFRGSVQTDRFTQELTMLPRDIMITVAEERMDDEKEKRVELHLHTKMSALDAVAGVEDVIKRVKSWGHPAVAITDHGVVQSFPEAYEVAKRIGQKVIYGMEGYIFDDKQFGTENKKVPTYHCLILVLNQEGLRNIYELTSISHLQYFYRVPRIPKSKLHELREGLLIGTACEAGELIRMYLQGADVGKLEEIASFYDFLEIQPRGNNRFMLENGTFKAEEELLKMNKTIYELGLKLQKPVVATGDVHFLDPEDEVYRRILMAGKGFEDADNQAPLYLMTTKEMLHEFSYLGEKEAYEVVIANPQRIAEAVEDIKPIPDELYPPAIPGAEEEINNLSLTKAHELYGEKLPDLVQERLDKELKAIIDNGFAVLYLIAHKLVKKSNDDGYLVGSRGSVGSSLVATLCGITEVNPLPPHYRCNNCYYTKFFEDKSTGSGADLSDMKCPNCGKELQKEGHDIPFEVFLGFEGDKVPDIDLNFSGEYQPRAHKYTEILFGKDNVFRAGTIATVANKTAYGFVKNYFDDRKKFVRGVEINRLVKGCTGVKRTTGQHPGGIMVLPKGLDIHRFTPLQRPADDVKSSTRTTHFDYHAISSRLVKLDILGHDDPTVIKMLEDLTGVDSREIPLDEPKVLSIFKGSEALGFGTLGIPEFGTKFVRQMLEDTKPATFSDLVRISGFSHGTDVWLNNAQELLKTGTAKMPELISARDDIMIYLIRQGLDPDMAFKIMEDVRKGKGIKPSFEAEMQNKGVPQWYIESCKKIKYMFPKAHAVAYVMMAFRIAYFKVYHPAAFYASYFSVRADEFDADITVKGIESIKDKMLEIQKKGKGTTQREEKLFSILEVAHEMYLRGIGIKMVNLAESDSFRFLVVEDGKMLLPPFISLQGLGRTAAKGIVEARKKKMFSSREDLSIRGRINKSIIEMLDNHGSLKGLPDNDQMTLF